MKQTWIKMKEMGKKMAGSGRKAAKACNGPLELYRKRDEIWRHLKPYKKEICGTIIASILVMLISSSTPFVLGRLIDKRNSLSDELLLMIIVVLYLAYSAKDYLDKYVTENKEKISLYGEIDLRCKVNDYLSRLPFGFYQKNGIGEVEDKISRAANFLYYLVSDVLFQLLSEIILCVIVFVLLLSVNYLFSAIIAVTIIIHTVLTLMISESKIESEKEIRHGFNSLASLSHDTAINFSAVKSLKIENFVGQEHYKQGAGIKHSVEALFKKISSKDFLQRNILTVGTIASYGLMLYLLKEGSISPGNVIIVIGYVAMLTGPFSNLSRQYSVIKRSMVSFESVNEILNEKEEAYDVGEDVKIPNGSIEFKNLSFTPTEGNETLIGVNMEIPEGPGLYAIVGESGSGKTTLWKILLRYLCRYSGKISFGGVSIQELKISSLREHILSVEGKTLFTKSIRDNVKIGNLNVSDDSDDKVKAALGKVRLSYLIDYLDRVVGSSKKSSDGENQRIVLARALINDTASVLFFDEPTQALDPINSDNAMKLLKELSLTKKVIVITHDLLHMIEAKKIFVMEKGRMVESGTHEELMNLNGKYAEHFAQQNEITRLLRNHTDA